MDKNLDDLASEDVTLHSENRRNNTLCGPCPNYPEKCDRGNDGFVVFMDAYDGQGGFSCRGCWDPKNPPILPDRPRLGDMIDYYRHFKDMSFSSAKQAKEEYLSGAVDSTIKRVDRMVEKKRQARNVPPPEQWQESRKRIVDEAVKRLYTPEGKPVLEYLLQRGLTEETIKACKFGAIRSSMVNALYVTKPVMVDTWLVVIPWYLEGLQQLWKVELRDIRPDCPQSERYRMFSNSSNGLYLADCLDRKLPTIIVEGVFDAAIIAQEAGDLVNVVATGSTENAQISLWVMRLARMPVCFLGFDNEEKGEAGTEFWAKSLAHKSPMRVRPVGAKDANAMHLRKAGFVRMWVEMALEAWQEGSVVLADTRTDEPILFADSPSQEIVTSDAAAAETDEEETDEEETDEIDTCLCGLSVEADEGTGNYIETDARIVQYVCSQCVVQQQQVEEWAEIAGRTFSDWTIEVVRTSDLRAMIDAISSPASLPGPVPIEKLPARSYTYAPVKLPPLPRTICPHKIVYEVRSNDKKHFLTKQKKCTGKPGASGWCKDHEAVQRFLDIGAKLNYPELTVSEFVTIPAGTASWEDTATRLLISVNIQKNGKFTKTRDLYSRIMPTLERRVKLQQSA